MSNLFCWYDISLYFLLTKSVGKPYLMLHILSGYEVMERLLTFESIS